MSISSAASGNFSATTTWTGGVVPTNADTIVINHQVTLDISASVGGIDPASTGSLIGSYPALHLLVGVGRPAFRVYPLIV